MGRKDVVLKSFTFSEQPSFTPRTPYYWMTEEEKLSITKFPFISDKKIGFTIVFTVKGEEYTLEGCIPKGFSYNLADIPWILEPLAYDKHSPFVKDASYIHDYLISRKRKLYELWDLKAKGITPENFRILTSLIFLYQLSYNGVRYTKAHLMSFFVDLWQSLIPSWRTLDKTEIGL